MALRSPALLSPFSRFSPSHFRPYPCPLFQISVSPLVLISHDPLQCLRSHDDCISHPAVSLPAPALHVGLSLLLFLWSPRRLVIACVPSLSFGSVEWCMRRLSLKNFGFIRGFCAICSAVVHFSGRRVGISARAIVVSSSLPTRASRGPLISLFSQCLVSVSFIPPLRSAAVLSWVARRRWLLYSPGCSRVRRARPRRRLLLFTLLSATLRSFVRLILLLLSSVSM